MYRLFSHDEKSPLVLHAIQLWGRYSQETTNGFILHHHARASTSSTLILSGKDEERVAAFGMSLIDRRIPYRHYMMW